MPLGNIYYTMFFAVKTGSHVVNDTINGMTNKKKSVMNITTNTTKDTDQSGRYQTESQTTKK
ncbi:unnamed protein product [Oppiella nova]|uniref:Uncharacterized protein n=1 Tax=Oppiella nova TaxID=334625 RepID=A0A7R9QH48_9ACAR|nr:unnamed protein product [Oppiella nova]CAG2165663.1 unnamed protein product [Oppiella nova]